MRIDILSLFPEYFEGPFATSMIRQAILMKRVEIEQINIRDFAENKHRRVDEKPYGGGPGMLLKPEPVAKAIQYAKERGGLKEKAHVVYFSPQGKKLTQKMCKDYLTYSHLILLCGHYEGVDQRIIDAYVDEEVSIGDYILTNGCAAALVFVDAVVRLIPGVLGNTNSLETDSFTFEGGFGPPRYTRPEIFKGMKVPFELLSGDHQLIKEFEEKEAKNKTRRVRPDLLA